MERTVSPKSRHFDTSPQVATRLVFDVSWHFGFLFRIASPGYDDNGAYMDRINSTSSAALDTKEIVKRTLDQTRELALEEAAQKKLKVSEVKDVQREKIAELFKPQNSDQTVAPDMEEEIIEAADKEHDERMKNIAAAPDAYVLPSDGTVVGLQHDDTRKIGIAGRALDSDRVAKHEAKHREQEVGDQYVDLPPTGDPKIDEISKLSRRALRENGAVKAEGGLKDHTPEYHEYVESSESIATYLNAQGMDGDKMVDEAGDTNAGFDQLHDSIMIASIRQKLGEQVPDAEKVLAA